MDPANNTPGLDHERGWEKFLQMFGKSLKTRTIWGGGLLIRTNSRNRSRVRDGIESTGQKTEYKYKERNYSQKFKYNINNS
jgi:hypothetical protein